MISKRVFDIILTGTSLVIIFPVFIVIAIAIKTEDRHGTVFFRQNRVGQHGKIFKIFKFRTMVADAEKNGIKLSTTNDRRITKIGAFLRTWKLDELPQLINVLTGDMSIVGPRPEVPEYIEYYSEHEKHMLLSVKPGITDLASIEFRDEDNILSKSDDIHQAYIKEILPIKKELYFKYIDNISIINDIKIIIRTVKAIIF